LPLVAADLSESHLFGMQTLRLNDNLCRIIRHAEGAKDLFLPKSREMT